MSNNNSKSLKIYEIHNRSTGERHFSVATNGQDACSLAGWQIGDCFINEVKEQQGHSKAGEPPLKVKIPCHVCLYQYAECRLPGGQQCPCRPESPDQQEWYKQACLAHLCDFVGQQLKRDDYNLCQKWCPMDEAIRELEHHHLP